MNGSAVQVLGVSSPFVRQLEAVRSHPGTLPLIYRSLDDVPGLQENWAKARETEAFFCGEYRDYAALAEDQDGPRVAVLKTASGSELMLPFTIQNTLHSFAVGERRLGRVSLRTLRLANPWLAEGHAPGDIAKLLAHALVKERVDLVSLGEIQEESALRAALSALPWPTRTLRLGRNDSVRWLIDLPGSFDAYLGSLPPKERKNLGWKMRKVEKDFEVRVETFTDTSDLERFLEEGERISRQTYQWNVGQQLRNDKATLDRFRMLAEQGRLRCYLLLLDGTPRAFARGISYGGIFHEETPGFDPDFAKYSIGTIMLLRVLQDLIENSTSKVYDFGTGGDWSGFKSRFGNRSLVCNSYYVLNTVRPRAVLLLTGHTALNGMKNLTARVIRNEAVRDRIRRRLRKYGN